VKKHIPVLKKESIEQLNIKDGGTYIDCTLGEGGHATEIINNLTTGNLIALDVDQKHVDDFVKETKEIGNVHIYARNANFSNLERVVDGLKEEGITKVDGVLFDLGWHQINSREWKDFRI
jgi:16S rRNA (cytosine1402-N4)-methyltransferase